MIKLFLKRFWIVNLLARFIRFKISVFSLRCSKTPPPRGIRIAATTASILGNVRRLHVHPTAVMQNTLFNVSSGDIYVDEGAFCGHNCMLITGTHYYKLAGMARHNAPRYGRDIRIGKYVWLCSGVTVLGNTEIGDNAVIAAGSVVTYGSKIPSGEVWGGTPAKYIKKITD